MEAQKSGRRPHVVALPVPTRGHINPMMHLCKMLAAQGVSVTFVNSEHNDKLVADAEREALQRLGIRLEAIPDGLAAHVDRTAELEELLEVIFSAMPQPFEALIARLFRQQQRPPPSCILADMWLSTFTLPAASQFRLPHASLWTQSAVSFTNLLMVSNGSYIGPAQGEPCIRGAEFLKEEDLNTLTRGYDQSDGMFRFVTRGFDRLDQSRWIFLNTFEELESETLKALREDLEHLDAIGPLLPSSLFTSKNEKEAKYTQSDDLSSLWVEEEDCLTWLNKFGPNSVLYVSFGSLAMISSQQFEEIALGLEASGHPFLWVARPDLVPGGLPDVYEMFRERVKERAYFVSWAPQLRVLSHKSVGGFFTHGGWNSTLEGISIGVPMLGWPYFSDQPMVCKCIEERWKLGLRLTKGGTETLVPRDIIEAKVKELMGSHTFLNKACEWSSLAKKAALRGGSSFKKLQGFVETLKHQ